MRAATHIVSAVGLVLGAAAAFAACDVSRGQEPDAPSSAEEQLGQRPAVAEKDSEMPRAEAVQKSAQAALAISLGKAQELEYKLDTLLIEMHEQPEGGWLVQFNPRDKQQRGGNLTVHVDSKGEITDVQRWR